MNNQFIKTLTEFGLGEKEAKTYIALLELEIAGVQEIAKAAKLNRSSTYVTLESLKNRGLVSVSEDKKVRQYIATPPDAILRTAEDATNTQSNLQRKIENILPEMKALYRGTRKKPSVKVYEGSQGIINVFRDTFTAKEKLIRIFSSTAMTEKILPRYMIEYVKKRYEIGLKMRGIHPRNKMYSELSRIIPKGFDEAIDIPESSSKFSADLAIYDNKVGYISNEYDGLGILIESKEMADVMKGIFDLAFEEAKRLSKDSQRTTKSIKKVKS
jgi:sugar-specific transcriptional regulator TrmB